MSKPNGSSAGGVVSSSSSKKPPYRVFIALFDYDPFKMSPNTDSCQEELAFKEGQLIKVYGKEDDDGFFYGESSGRSGYIPCNMVSELQADDPEVVKQLLMMEQQANESSDKHGRKKSSVRGSSAAPATTAATTTTTTTTTTATTKSSANTLNKQQSMSKSKHQEQQQFESSQYGSGGGGGGSKSGTSGRGAPPQQPQQQHPKNLMVALYDYDPQSLSPNVDADAELSFKMGDIINVIGEMDDDGFFMGELNSRRGLVPSNFLEPIQNAEQDQQQPQQQQQHHYKHK